MSVVFASLLAEYLSETEDPLRGCWSVLFLYVYPEIEWLLDREFALHNALFENSITVLI